MVRDRCWWNICRIILDDIFSKERRMRFKAVNNRLHEMLGDIIGKNSGLFLDLAVN